MLSDGSFRKIAVLSCGPAASAIASLALVLLISWNFPPKFLGIIAILELVATISTMVFTFGFDHAYVREFASEPRKENLFNTATRVPAIGLLFAVSLIFLMLPFTNFGLTIDNVKIVLFIIVTYGAAAVAIRMLSIIIRMQGRIYLFFALQLAQRTVAVFLILVILNTPFPRTLAVVLTCYLVGSLISTFLHAFFLKKEISAAINLPLDKKLAARLAHFGVPAGVSALAYTILASSDRITLALWGGTSELGIYAVAQSMAAALAMFTSVISLIWAPYVYNSDLEGGRAAEYAPQADAVVLASYLAGGLICSASWLAPMLFPTDYSGMPHFVPACAALPLFYIVAEVFGVGIGVARRMNFAVGASALSAIVALATGTGLVPSLGATGAALAILVGSLVFLITRTELAALLWQRLPARKMYLATAAYTIGAILSLIFDVDYIWLIQLYWVLYFIFLIIMFHSSLCFIKKIIQTRLVN